MKDEVKKSGPSGPLDFYFGILVGKENSPKKGFPDVNRVGDHFGLRLNVKNTLLVSVNCSERKNQYDQYN